MKFGAIIIGDEILSGKRQDKHLAKVIATLGERGLELSWAQYLGDDPELITTTLRRTFAGADAVFSFGGIGATPDDHTRQCAARAGDVALKLHPQAEAEIRGRFVDDPKGVTPQRLMMGEFPEGAEIIPNPYNRIPGFSFCNHHFLPGFPEMAWPMMAWVLDHRYAGISAERAAEAAIIVRDAGESQLIELMNECLRTYPALKVFSLPRVTPERYIELGVRGSAAQVPQAIAMLQTGVSRLGFPWTPAAA
ncbi:MAG: molybdopterin-binding protein [Burkholderiales bacterium]|nr:molybdopterin-binding protein [Burkholderiales bacterium]MDP2397122.1 molybdopterin-binding protein [Burkholderiales bacterium]